MGWSFLMDATRKDLIRELTHETETRKCLKKCTRGNVLWTVWEYRAEDGETKRYIGCDLMQKQRGYGWGYKDMCESVHPYYYSCPLSYLKLAPVASEEWRAEVHKYHAATQPGARPKVGDTIMLPTSYSVRELKIVSVKPLTGMGLNSMRYRISHKVLRAARQHQDAMFAKAMVEEKK